MSTKQRPQRNKDEQRDGFQTFAPTVNFESMVMSIIQTILLSPTLVSSVGDATQAHSVARELVQWFDDFAYSVLSDFLEDSPNVLTSYVEERNNIIEKWRQEKGDDMRWAHELFRLTTLTLSRNHLFKIKRYGWFSVNKKLTEQNVVTPQELMTVESTFED